MQEEVDNQKDVTNSGKELKASAFRGLARAKSPSYQPRRASQGPRNLTQREHTDTDGPVHDHLNATE